MVAKLTDNAAINNVVLLAVLTKVVGAVVIVIRTTRAIAGTYWVFAACQALF